MAQPSPTLDTLSELLQASATPIYAVDSGRRIVFANRACSRLFGVEAANLEGRQCRYHHRTDVPLEEQQAAALCPPPSAYLGRPVDGRLVLPQDDGTAEEHSAWFLPLRPADQRGSFVLVIVDVAPASPAARGSTVETPPAESLHERLAVARRRQRERYTPERLIGTSAPICRARAQAVLATKSHATVLVVGPVGSGREHIARTIHGGRAGPDGPPLVPLACDLLQAELLQSTLEAVSRSQESAAAADAPTLLLNDVDALPRALHRELADALTRESPLRVLATARRRVDELPDDEFDSRLACALTTLVIEMPPLNRRTEDIDLLAQAALEDLNAAGEKQLQGFSDEALQLLAAYPWPGNLDELRDVIRHAHDHATGPWVEAQDLPQSLRLAPVAFSAGAEAAINLDAVVRRVEVELIQRALLKAKGNKAQAARMLGLTRQRLYRRMEQLSLFEDGSSGERQEP